GKSVTGNCSALPGGNRHDSVRASKRVNIFRTGLRARLLPHSICPENRSRPIEDRACGKLTDFPRILYFPPFMHGEPSAKCGVFRPRMSSPGSKDFYIMAKMNGNGRTALKAPSKTNRF